MVAGLIVTHFSASPLSYHILRNWSLSIHYLGEPGWVNGGGYVTAFSGSLEGFNPTLQSN